MLRGLGGLRWRFLRGSCDGGRLGGLLGEGGKAGGGLVGGGVDRVAESGLSGVGGKGERKRKREEQE